MTTTGRGPAPDRGAAPWITDAYGRYGFPCDTCRHLTAPEPGTPIRNRDLCRHCRAQRRALLRTRQKWDSRHGHPLPAITITGPTAAALTAAVTALRDALTRDSAPHPDPAADDQSADRRDAASGVPAVTVAARHLLDALHTPVQPALTLTELERHGFLPPFERVPRP